MDPYRQRRNELKAEVAARVRGGEPLRDVCRAPGMPCDATVRNWRRADPTFAAEMAQALHVGRWRRIWMVDDAKAKAILARYGAGERIARILKDPAMPSRKVFDHWLRTDPNGFGAEFYGMKRENEAWRVRGIRNKPRPFDRAVADRIVVRVGRGETLRAVLADPAMPSRTVVARWRQEDEDFRGGLAVALQVSWRHRRRFGGRWAAAAEKIVDGILAGGSLHSVAGRDGVPCVETLYRWMREKPEFARQVRLACDMRDEWLADRVLTLAEGATPETAAAVKAQTAPLRRRLAWTSRRPGDRAQ